MAGLWYEYVWDSSFAQDYSYKCSTWIVLSDEADKGPGHYQVYNNMVYATEGEDKERDAEFIKFPLHWDIETEGGKKASASYQRKDEENAEKESPARTVNFIDTDYH